MAGTGRNGQLLLRSFKTVELLEQSPKLNKMIDLKKYILHDMRIQRFKWLELDYQYDCIFGCWCLCYLNTNDRDDLYKGMRHTINRDGYLVFIEPVLKTQEKYERF